MVSSISLLLVICIINADFVCLQLGLASTHHMLVLKGGGTQAPKVRGEGACIMDARHTFIKVNLRSLSHFTKHILQAQVRYFIKKVIQHQHNY